MKHILIAFLIALGLGLIFTSKSQVGEPYIKLNEKEPLLFDSITSIFVKAKVEEISAKNQFVPLFFVFEGKLYFIKSNTDRLDDSLFVGNKFGIIGQNGEVILEQKYDKIYNPNFTITNCLEIAQKGKVGLINLKINKIIEPQFEYIVPSGNIPNHIAYGLKGNDWYELNSETMQQTPSPNYSPEQFLSELDMEFTMNKTDYFINTYGYLNDLLRYIQGNDAFRNYVYYGNSNIIMPSFGKILGNHDFFTNIVITEEDGIKKLKIKNRKSYKFKDFILKSYELMSFVVGTRDGFWENKYKYLVYDNKKIKTNFEYEAKDIQDKDNDYSEYVFGEYKVIYDSILVVDSYIDRSIYNEDEVIYSANNIIRYTKSNYLILNKQNKFEKLENNRFFTITKYEKLVDSLLKTTYIIWQSPKTKSKTPKSENDETDEFYNYLYIYQHPSIKHLNLMRNEILADYGYIFKEKEWNEYFSKMKWYKPQYQDVSMFLTEIDKHNINYIDKLIKKMKGKEKKFTKPEKYEYPMAG